MLRNTALEKDSFGTPDKHFSYMLYTKFIMVCYSKDSFAVLALTSSCFKLRKALRRSMKRSPKIFKQFWLVKPL